MTDVASLTQGLGLELGGGAVLGFIGGYATKLIWKVCMVLIGGQLALFKYLETKGVLTVDWSKLSDSASNASDTGAEIGKETAGHISAAASALPFGAGFTGGFLVGFKKA